MKEVFLSGKHINRNGLDESNKENIQELKESLLKEVRENNLLNFVN